MVNWHCSTDYPYFCDETEYASWNIYDFSSNALSDISVKAKKDAHTGTWRRRIIRAEAIQRAVRNAIRCGVCVQSCCVCLSTRIRKRRERIRVRVGVWIVCWCITDNWCGMRACGRARCVRSVISGEFWFIEVRCRQSHVHFRPFVRAFDACGRYHATNVSHVFNEKFPSNNSD